MLHDVIIKMEFISNDCGYALAKNNQSSVNGQMPSIKPSLLIALAHRFRLLLFRFSSFDRYLLGRVKT